MIYVDSSALLKLLRSEAETGALHAWMNDHREVPLVSSLLAKVEVVQAARRYRDHLLGEPEALLSTINLIPLRTAIAETACRVGDPPLCSLDALHLASALAIRGEISNFCTYDHRLRAAAAAVGLPTVAPGQPEAAQ